MKMKKILTDIRTVSAVLMASATLAACSNDDNITSEQPVQPTEQVYTMTVSAQKGGASRDQSRACSSFGEAQPALDEVKGGDGSKDNADSRTTTRALSLDDKTLNAAWAEGEAVTVYNVTKGADLSGTLVAQSSGASTTLKGELTGTIENGDQLTLKFLSPAYNSQDGTLTGSATSIDRVCDYAEATVTVASVAGGNITVREAAADFQNRQAIVKFTLKDQDGHDLNVSSLTISAGSKRLVSAGGSRGSGAKTYYTGYTVDAGTDGTWNEGYDKLLDGNTGTKWCTNTKSDGVYFVEFHTASAVLVDGYKLTTGGDTQDYSGRNPKNWTLKAKANSGDAWTVIDTKTGNTDMPAANQSSVDFEADVQGGTYQYFRLEVSAVQSGDWLQLSEMQLYGCSDRKFSYLYGDVSVTPAAATNELTVALNNQSGAPDTYTLSATDGSDDYSYTKSGVNFESGKYYAITVKMTKQAAVDLSTLKANYVAKNGDVLTGTLPAVKFYDKIKITIADGATVTLKDANISGWTDQPADGAVTTVPWAGITCAGDATIILKGANTVKGFYESYPGIYVPEGKTVTIKGDGSLYASSNNDGAGIGGGRRTSCGNITIEGGTITATGGRWTAGIGAGIDAACGNILITGGTINATGGYQAPGIGSGWDGSCGDITITRGVTSVTATKGNSAPNSIGKGYGSSASCGTVTIGGTVTGNITTSPYTYQP